MKKFAAKHENSTKHHIQSHNFPKNLGTQQQKRRVVQGG